MDSQNLASGEEVPLGWAGQVKIIEDGLHFMLVGGRHKRVHVVHVAEPKDPHVVRE